MTLPPIHVLPFIGAQALYRIASLDPVAGQPFGSSKKGKDVYHAMLFGPIDEVFADVAPQEAMFVCYRRRDNGPLPRLTKACEGRIDLVCDYAAFDIDLNAQFGEKGKLPWTKLGEERAAEIERRLERLWLILAEKDAAPLCWYRSKNGLRVLHQLHEPVTPAGLEMVCRRLATYYAEAGIEVDSSCFDWTRCFKTPRCILEDGTQTDQQPWFEIEWFEGAVTIATPEEIVAEARLGHPGDVSLEARREASHARELVELDGKLTENGRAASARIASDPQLHSICFGSTPIVGPEENWHDQLTRILGRLTKRCVGEPWATEQFLYGLVAQKIAELGESERHDWLAEGWEMLCAYLASDRAAIEQRNEEVKAIECAAPAEAPVIRLAPETRDTLADLVDKMVAANTECGPRFFTGIEGTPVQVGGTKDSPEIVTFTGQQAFAFLVRNFRFIKRVKKEDAFVDPPAGLVKAVTGSVNFGDGRLPVLEAISRAPRVNLKTGEINQEGFADGTLVIPDPALDVAVPERPSPEEVAEAADYLRETFSEFPWREESDFTGFAALILTSVAATSWGSEPTPFFFIHGNRPGVGKTILAAAACAAANVPFVARPITSGVDGELDKNATAALMAGSPVVVWDNLPTEAKIDSPVIASAVTAAPYCEVRPLGTSENCRVRGNGVKVGTGNNNTFTSEITRRLVPIRLESDDTKPERRKFRIESLATHVWEDRSRLISAGLTILRAWILNGRKQYPEVPRFGSFDCWARVVGNALHEAGLRDFLGNQDELAEDASEDDANRVAVLSMLLLRGTKEFTAKEALPLLKDTCAFLVKPGSQVDAPRLGIYLNAIKNVWTEIEGGKGKATVTRAGMKDGRAVWQFLFEANN